MEENATIRDIPLEAIYAAYGKAVLFSHHLERQLVFCVASWGCLKDRADDGAFLRTVESLHRKTLGDVIKVGIENGAVSGEMSDALSSARKLRNILVHSITDSLPLRLATKRRSEEVFEELWDIGDSFRELARELSEMAEICCELRGFSVVRIHALALRVIERASALETLAEPNKPMHATCETRAAEACR